MKAILNETNIYSSPYLKPCPFCGATAHYDDGIVGCDANPAHRIWLEGDDFDDVHKTINEWNSRAGGD